MDPSQLLATAGVLGLLAALCLAALFLLVQPIWAIIDCVDSERETETKLLVSLALLATWGVGSLLYGLFFAGSRNLRRFTVASLILLFLAGVTSIGACTVGAVHAARQAQGAAEAARLQAEREAREFRPPTIAPDALAPFRALHVVHEKGRPITTAVADFTLTGPEPATARDVSAGVRHVAAADAGLFALTAHGFGAISPNSGELVEIGVDPRLAADFSWPKGIAYDSASERIVILTSHVYTRFFRYDPRTAAWERLPSEQRDLPLVALAWLPTDETLYALERRHGEPRLTGLYRFNGAGASLGVLPLDPPIPVPPDLDAGFQLHTSSGRLVLMFPASPGAALPDPIFVIDPASGAVAVAAKPASP